MKYIVLFLSSLFVMPVWAQCSPGDVQNKGEQTPENTAVDKEESNIEWLPDGRCIAAYTHNPKARWVCNQATTEEASTLETSTQEAAPQKTPQSASNEAQVQKLGAALAKMITEQAACLSELKKNKQIVAQHLAANKETESNAASMQADLQAKLLAAEKAQKAAEEKIAMLEAASQAAKTKVEASTQAKLLAAEKAQKAGEEKIASLEVALKTAKEQAEAKAANDAKANALVAAQAEEAEKSAQTCASDIDKKTALMAQANQTQAKLKQDNEACQAALTQAQAEQARLEKALAEVQAKLSDVEAKYLAAQKIADDLDQDGVANVADFCPHSAAEASVLATGCVDAAIDLVYFDTDSAVLTDTAKATLQHAASVLAQHPDKTFIVQGHTDNQGSTHYNLKLSQQRVQTVMAYLQTQGVAESQLEAVAEGEQKPIASNTKDKGRAQNRRVVLHLKNMAP